MTDYASEMRLFDPVCGERLYLDAEERERFLQAANLLRNREHRLFCELLHWSGARLSEVLALTGRHVDFERRTLTFRTLKKRKYTRKGELKALVYRQVPVPATLLQLLDMCYNLRDRQIRQEPSVANPLWGHKQRPERPISRATGWRIVERVFDDADIVGAQASPKSLRHGFAVAMIMGGMNLYTLQHILGHERPETTAIYLQVKGQEAQSMQMQYWAEANKDWQ